MSVKIAQAMPVNQQGKDSFGLPVQDPTTSTQSAGVPYQVRSVTPRGSKGLQNGVRVPVLNDLNPKYGYAGGRTTCRFDIVETVTTVIKPGAYGPDDGVQNMQTLESPGRSTDSKRKGLGSRQPTYHSTVSSLSRQSDHSVLDRIPPYQWTHKLKTAKEADARDVLYRNSFCPTQQHIRFRTLKLPRISDDERPWTVGGVPMEGTPESSVYESGEYSKTITIVPQQPRPTVVRFHEVMKPDIYASSNQGFEVKRMTSSISRESRLHMARTGILPLILQDSRKFSRKTERPLKFETSRFSYSQGRNFKSTLFSKRVPAMIRNAFDRDYTSADTFKEYLDGLQNATSANAAFLYTREGTRDTIESRRSIDNQALQSVTAVNQPEEPDVQPSQQMARGSTAGNSNSQSQEVRPITVEIKSSWKETEDQADVLEDLQKQETNQRRTKTIDELSSVHGSEAVARAHSDVQSATFPVSSSVINGVQETRKPTIVPSTVLPDGPTEVAEADISAPSNTPTPPEDNEAV